MFNFLNSLIKIFFIIFFLFFRPFDFSKATANVVFTHPNRTSATQISTGNPIGSNSYCVNSVVEIPYTADSPFNANNVFTIQLSDADGNFAYPKNIKPSNAAGFAQNGVLRIELPPNIPQGIGYRFRVVSSSPAIVGQPNLWPTIIKNPLLNVDLNTFNNGIEWNGHYYYVSKVRTDWKSAQAVCQANGGYLVTINTKEENDTVVRLTGERFWIGYTDEASEGIWKWVTNETTTYENWARNEPNNLNDEDYALTNWSGTGSTTWNDYSNNNSLLFVMEISLNNASNNGPVCQGQTLNLSSNTLGGATYSWIGPNGFFSNQQNPAISNAKATQSGSYYLIITRGGCVSELQETPVAILNTPSPITTGASRCDSGSVILRASGGVGDNYRWFTSLTDDQFIANATSDSYLTPVLTKNTTYYVSIVDPIKQCISNRTPVTASIGVQPPKPEATANDTVIGGTIYLKVKNINGAIFSWSGPNGFTSTQQNPVITNVTIAMSGAYIVRAKIGNCNSISDTVQVGVYNIPNTVATGKIADTLCANGSLTVPYVAGGIYNADNIFTAQVSDATGSFANPITIGNSKSTASGNIIATLPASVTAGGNYKIRVVASSPATIGSANAGAFYVYEGVAPPALLLQRCGPGTLTFNAKLSGINDGNYRWYQSPSDASLIPNAVNSQFITPQLAANTNFYVAAIYPNGCRSRKTTVQAIVNVLPVITTKKMATCVSDTALAITGFSPAGGQLKGAFLDNGVFNAASAGVGSHTYAYVYTAPNGCIDSSVNTIDVYDLPTRPTITINGGQPDFCSGDSLFLSASTIGSPSIRFDWTTGDTTNAFYIKQAATVAVRAVNKATGCVSPLSDALTLSIKPRPNVPTIFPADTVKLCAGDSIVLQAPPGLAEYLWSNNATGNAITIKQGGQYSLAVKDISGCKSLFSTATTVVFNPLPVVKGQDHKICLSDTAFTLSGFTPVGGLLQGDYINNGKFNAAAAGVGLHPVAYTFTDNKGCTNTANQTVRVLDLPAKPVIVVPTHNKFCDGDSLQLSLANFSATLQANWTNGDTAQHIFIKQTSQLAVRVTDRQTGCTSLLSDTVLVKPNPNPAVPVIAPSDTVRICAGDSVRLQAPSGFASYIWSNNATASSVVITASGNYSLVLTDSNACRSPQSKATTVIVNPRPAVQAGSSRTLCAGEKITLGAPAIPGFEYKWTPDDPALSNALVAQPLFSLNNQTDSVVSKKFVLYVANQLTSCSSLDSVSLQVRPALPFRPTDSLVLCSGVSKTIGSAAVIGYQYRWFPTLGLGDTLAAQTSIQLTNTGSAPKHITYFRTISANGCASVDTFVVSVYPRPQLNPITGNNYVCPGKENVPYTLGGKKGNYSVQWFVSKGTFLANNATDSTIAVSWDAGDKELGAVKAIAVSPAGCLSDTVQLAIDISRVLKPSVAIVSTPSNAQNDKLCLANASKLVYAVKQPGNRFRWNVDGDTLPYDNTGRLIKNWQAAGNHKLYVLEYDTTLSGGVCFGRSPLYDVTIHPMPATAPIVGDTAICGTQQTREYKVNGFINSVFQWTKPSQGEILSANADSSAIVVKWLQTGSEALTVREKSQFGCMGSPVTLNIAIRPTPLLAIVRNDSAICSQDTASLTYAVSSTVAGTYTWYVKGGEIKSGQGTNQITVKWDKQAAHSRYLRVSQVSAVGACSSDTLGFLLRLDDARIDVISVGASLTNSADLLVRYRVSNRTYKPLKNVYVQRRVKGTSVWQAPIAISVDSTLYTDPGASTQVYEYRVYAPTLCNDTIYSVTPQHNILLNGTARGNISELNWNAYTGWPDGSLRYRVYRQLDGQGGFVLYDVASTNKFESVNGIDGFKHCYRIAAIKNGNEDTISWSNPVCISFDHKVLPDNVFTPNGDNVNEYFLVPNLEPQLYPNNELRIFNRWGKEVYKVSPYRNDWNAAGIPDGTYFYELRVGRDNEVIKGWVQIIR